MKIEKGNIESFIFDYHEGNLSDSEKTEVLNYIHNHPEYEAEFTQWAQSYLPYENTIHNYGITNKLLQPSPTLWYNKITLKIAVSATVVLLISMCFLIYEKTNTISTVKPTLLPKEIKQNESSSGIMKISADTMIQAEGVSHASSKNTGTGTFQYIPVNTHQTDSSSVLAPVLPIVNSETPSQKTSVAASETIKADSTNALKNSEPAPDVRPKDEINKKRKSHKIQPTNKFIPTNPDF